MNALGVFLQTQLDQRRMSQADLSRAAGVSEATISRMMQAGYKSMPEPQTIAGLARAFPPMSETDVLLHVARAIGFGVDATEVPTPETMSDQALIRELSRRLAAASDGPVIQPIDLLSLGDGGGAQLHELAARLKKESNEDAQNNKPELSALKLHLADYLLAIMRRTVTGLGLRRPSDRVQASDPQ